MSEFKQIRTIGRLNADYKIKDIYKAYVNYKETKKEQYLEYKDFKNICLACNKKVVNLIIKTNLLFIMPYRMGNISIRKYKTKLKEGKTINGSKILNYPVDWKATKQMWVELPETAHKKVIYIDNDHTSGYRFKFLWNIYNAKFKNKTNVAFKPLRKISRALASEIKSNPDFEAYELIK